MPEQPQKPEKVQKVKRTGYHRKFQRTLGLGERKKAQLKRTKLLIAAAFEVWRLKRGISYP